MSLPLHADMARRDWRHLYVPPTGAERQATTFTCAPPPPLRMHYGPICPVTLRLLSDCCLGFGRFSANKTCRTAGELEPRSVVRRTVTIPKVLLPLTHPPTDSPEAWADAT